MNTPYICLRCSRQILRTQRPLRKASFVSLGKLVSPDDGNVRKHDETLDDFADPSNVTSTYQEKRESAGVNGVLESLFEESLPRLRYSRAPIELRATPAKINNSVEHRLRELHNKLRRGTSSIEYIWPLVEELLGQKLWRPKDGSPADASCYRFFRDVLLAVCAKQRLRTKGKIMVSPRDVIRLYRKHGVLRYWWHQVLWLQLGHVLQLRYADASGEPPSREFPSLEMQRRDSTEHMRTLLKDILGVWGQFLHQYPCKIPNIPILENSDLEASHNASDQTYGTDLPINVTDRFLRLVPTHPNVDMASGTTAAAIMTFDCLNAINMTPAPHHQQFLTTLAEGRQIDRQIAARCLLDANVPSDIVDRALAAWGHAGTETLEISSSTKEPQEFLHSHDAFAWSDSEIELILRDVDVAVKLSQAGRVISLWQSYQTYAEAIKGKSEGIHDQIYARFLRAFWALRRPEQAIAVWNHFVESNRQPRQIHWNAMLVGCIQARDVRSLQEIWGNMVRSGMQPDINTWTTYINGLIRCRKWQEGFEMLEQLGRSWKPGPVLKELQSGAGQAEKTTETKDNTLSPSMAPVRAALSALIASGRTDLLQNVIRWAESQSLQLDTHTFNILLRPVVRTGTQSEIEALLHQMQTNSCSPDIATFTIILNGLVSNPTSTFHSLPPSEQEETITTILADMEANSIPPNTHTYSTLLDGLLSTKDKHQSTEAINIPAARTVLAHMQKKNIRPSPHIYTILVTHYFSLQPPDLPAIDSLCNSARHLHVPLDPIFYDRIIEGYSDCDEIEKALTFLRKMPIEGKSPGWMALLKLLGTMARAEEWDMCMDLVHDVNDEKEGLLRFGGGMFRGRDEFWELVDRLRGQGRLEDGRGEV
ncbi:hypothetical protein MMC28_010443 [Mycoblastus sanguinarius]|nr:hypothetical protein [Mycoblastus sanguinarius]